MSPKVALIFGYGPRVGEDVAKTFESKGYSIAVVSRSKQPDDLVKNYLALQADLADPSTIETTFKTVTEKLGHPTAVVYNAAGMAAMFDKSKSAPSEIAALQADFNVNTLSAYVAARLTVDSANALGSGPGTFIYTGNKLNLIVVPPLLSPGMGKAGAAHMINYLAEEYKDEGHKFYYADERKEDGNPVYSHIDGPAHAEFFASLAEEKTQQPWLATFVKGRGYVDFKETSIQVVGALHAVDQEKVKNGQTPGRKTG